MKDLSAPVRGSVTIWVSAGPEQCVVVRVLSCQLSPGAAAVVMMQGTGWCRNAEVPPHFALWDSVCRSPEGLIYLSQTPTVRWLWSHPRVVGNNIFWEGTGCGWRWGPCGGRQRFSGTNILALVPGDKHNTNTGMRFRMGMNCREGTRLPTTPKVLQTISRKVGKNRLCMITNLHRNSKTCLHDEEIYINL